MSDEIDWRSDGAREPSPSEDRGAPAPISYRKIAWPVLLSLSMLAIIAAFTFKPQEFARIASEVNPWILLAALAMIPARIFLGGWRLKYVSRDKLSLGDGVRGQLAWDFFSNVTPSAIGGGPFAAVYVARAKQINVGESTAFVLFTILLDHFWFALTIPILFAATFFTDLIPPSLGDVGAAGFLTYFAFMLATFVVFAYTTIFRPQVLQRIASFVFRLKWLRRFHESIERELLQLRNRAEILRSQPLRFYLNGLLLTVGLWMSRYLLLLFIVWSVFPSVDKILVLLRTAAMTLGAFIVPTPGGAGGLEGLYALLIGPLMPAAVVVPTLLVWRFLAFYLFIGLGIYLSTHHVQSNIRRRRRIDGDGSGSDSSGARLLQDREFAR